MQQLLPRLRDPLFTMVLLVTLPEATPIHEAMQLEHDLARADIRPFAWVVNQSLMPIAVTTPCCARDGATRPRTCASWRATRGTRRWNRGTPTSWPPSRHPCEMSHGTPGRWLPKDAIVKQRVRPRTCHSSTATS